jgi:hypothetical protein
MKSQRMAMKKQHLPGLARALLVLPAPRQECETSRKFLEFQRDQRKERIYTMSVQKKSLVGDRTAVKKAIVASKPDAAVGKPKALKAEALTFRAPKLKGARFRAAKLKGAF